MQERAEILRTKIDERQTETEFGGDGQTWTGAVIDADLSGNAKRESSSASTC